MAPIMPRMSRTALPRESDSWSDTGTGYARVTSVTRECPMKTKAAVVYEYGKPMEIEELELDGPREGEVLIRYTHAGLCHSDLHVITGDLPARLPMVLGHEGAGIVQEVGPGVTRAAPGD